MKILTGIDGSRRNILLLTEFILLFGGLPLLILYSRDRLAMLMALWIGALLIQFFLHHYHRKNPVQKLNWEGFRKGVAAILLRFAVLAPLIAALAWYANPENFLSLPRDRTGLWLQIMIFYPLLSVWPQELIYRSFIYHRYAPLFGTGKGYVAASSLMFGYMHILFLNWVAVGMTLIGGFLFSSDYSRNRSLALTCLEHALYGCLVFTVGLGIYFYSGAAWD